MAAVMRVMVNMVPAPSVDDRSIVAQSGSGAVVAGTIILAATTVAGNKTELRCPDTATPRGAGGAVVVGGSRWELEVGRPSGEGDCSGP